MRKTPDSGFKHKSHEKRSGFTLIEVLVAIFIFGMVISIVLSSFREVVLSAGIVNSNMTAYEMGKNAMDRMTGDLRSVYVSIPPDFVKPGFDAEPEPYRFSGIIEAVGSGRYPLLRFTSTAHLPLGGSVREGIAEIIYYVDLLENGEPVLRRSDRLELNEVFEKKDHPLLCRRVRAFSATYCNAEGDEFEEWDSESDSYSYATPVAVKLILETGPENGIAHVFETRVALPMFRPEMD